jgi:hypothetical protein
MMPKPTKVKSYNVPSFQLNDNTSSFYKMWVSNEINKNVRIINKNTKLG